MSSLESWTLGSHTADGVTHPTYRKGSGPGVIVIHEIPGITPAVLEFAEEVVARGFTVVMPSLFGRPGAPATVLETVRSIANVCVSREFTMFALGRTTPVATWLQSLARELHEELGGPGVGGVGMCLTGGYALAMLADAPVAAPVLAQPASPAPVGKARRGDLGLSPGDLESVKAKVAAGCQVLGLRYERDPAVGTRFETLRRELGDLDVRQREAGEGVPIRRGVDAVVDRQGWTWTPCARGRETTATRSPTAEEFPQTSWTLTTQLTNRRGSSTA